jgi:hypothetical protein
MADRLYQLLPTVYRQRDAEQGFQLQALLRVIAEQVNVVEADIAQLYENWFIETCQDWVVPYIGDLIGYQLVHEAGEPGDVATAEERLLNRILIPRRDVAHTIQHRRRKGTLSLLEQLANDVAGWPAHAVEFYRLLGWTQAINALRLTRGRMVDVREGDALDRLNGPFEELAHTVDVRRIASRHTPGRYNIPSVGLFVWRLNVYSVTETRARLLAEQGDELFTFSVLGNDTPLYTKVQPKSAMQKSAGALQFPTPIHRRQLEQDLNDYRRGAKSQQEYYGEGKSLFLWAGREEPIPEPTQPPADAKQSGKPSAARRRAAQPMRVVWEPVAPERIIAADLSEWRYRPVGDQIAIDPVLGRLAFAPNHVPEGGVRVLYHYAFSADMGGGEYHRQLTQPAGAYQLFQVSKEGDIRTLEDALERWEQWKADHPDQPQHAVIEITDSGVYVEERLQLSLGERETLQIRAADRTRPVIRLAELRPDRTGVLTAVGRPQLTGSSGSRLTLDGLLIFGRGLHLEGDLAEVLIRHCTLVPGWELGHDCEPKAANEASLTLSKTDARLIIQHSILGSVRVNEDEVHEEPLRMQISDSIVDAIHNEREVLGGSEQRKAYVRLTIRRSTVFGKVHIHALDLAENSLFLGLVKVARSQIGCVRFCYVPDGSRTPRRYHCQPDLVVQAVQDDDNIPETEKAAEMDRERARVEPVLNSRRYGTPTYCQLADVCAEEIRRGADDESEMGVFHDLFQPQRAANLRARLDEYTPADMETGIIYAS